MRAWRPIAVVLAAAAPVACIDFPRRLATCTDAGLCLQDDVGTGGGQGGGGGASGQPMLAIVPRSVVLAAPMGGLRQQIFTVQNLGTANGPLLFVSGCQTAPFSVAGDNCTGQTALPLGPPCTLTVEFRPSAVGTVMCTLAVSASGGSPPAIASLTGDSTGLDVTPNPVSFADTELDASITVLATVTNLGTAMLPSLSVAVTSDAGEFSADASQCRAGLAADGGSCVVSLEFAPVFTGMASGELSLSPPGGVPTRVALSGSGYIYSRLDVQLTGTGTGRVVSPDAGIDCPGACAATLRVGADLVLSATAAAGSAFNGWSPLCMSSGSDCSLVLPGPLTLQARFDRPNRVFLSAPVPGNFLVGDHCGNAALAGGLIGTFRAFVFTSDGGPPSRVADLTGSRGWVRTDGLPFADTSADLLAGRLYYPPLTDALGAVLSIGTSVTITPWRGAAGADCSGWTTTAGTGTLGTSLSSGEHFANSGTTQMNCDAGYRVLCLETGRQVPVLPLQLPSDGKRAFVTGQVFPASVGQAQATLECQAEAAAAGLPRSSSFVVSRKLNGQSGASFLRLDGGTWHRVDGVRLFDAPGDIMVNGNVQRSALNVLADGGQVLVAQLAWTGSDFYSTAASNNTCNNWVGTGTGNVGRVLGSSGGFATPAVQCADAGMLRLYCFEP